MGKGRQVYSRERGWRPDLSGLMRKRDSLHDHEQSACQKCGICHYFLSW